MAGSSKKQKSLAPPPGFPIISANGRDMLPAGSFLSVATKTIKAQTGDEQSTTVQQVAARVTNPGPAQFQKRQSPAAVAVPTATLADAKPREKQNATTSKPLSSQTGSNGANHYLQTVHSGECELLKRVQGAQPFRASFKLTIRLDNNTACLVLSAPNKGENVKNVLDLQQPTFTHDYCTISSRKADQGSDYFLRLSSQERASKFCLYLENLQRAAVRGNGNHGPTVTKESSPSLASKPRNDSARIIPTKVQHSVNPDNKGTPEQVPANTASSAGTAAPSTTAAAIDTRSIAHTMDEGVTLVDIGDESDHSASTKKDGLETSTIEDAAEQLHALVKKILPEASALGLHLSDEAIADMEDAAIDSWLSKGFLESESDDMKTELLELLRILVRIKRKAEARKAQRPKTAAISSLKGYVNTGQPAGRIKYSSAEIATLSKNASPNSPRLDPSITSQNRTPIATSTTASVIVSTVSKHKAWLEQSLAERGGSSMEVDQTPPTKADLGFKTPLKPLVQEAAGLDSSRWSEPGRRVTNPAVRNTIVRPPPGLDTGLTKTPATRSVSLGLMASRWAH